MTVWYWKDDEQVEHGPFGPDKLLHLIREGSIQKQSLIRKDNSKWVAASEINGLWESAAKPYKIYLCAECGTQIDRPPTKCSKCERRVEKATEKTVTPDLNRPKQNSTAAAIAPKAIIAKLRNRLLPKTKDE